ncbi:hypothetical protein Tco_0101941, partial [Tanacetum coccineum]
LKSSKSSESKPDVGNGGADGVAQVRIRGGWLAIDTGGADGVHLLLSP